MHTVRLFSHRFEWARLICISAVIEPTLTVRRSSANGGYSFGNNSASRYHLGWILFQMGASPRRLLRHTLGKGFSDV